MTVLIDYTKTHANLTNKYYDRVFRLHRKLENRLKTWQGEHDIRWLEMTRDAETVYNMRINMGTFNEEGLTKLRMLDRQDLYILNSISRRWN